MFPDQQNPNGAQPSQQPYQPQPQYGVNSAPQQLPNGQYAVVPPPSITGHPSGHNPYEFIVNPNNGHTSRSLLGNNTFLKKIIFIVSGAIVLMIVAAIALSALVPNTSDITTVTAIAEQQQEIIRVATLGTQQATGQSTRNFSANTELVITTDQKSTIAYLTKHHKKLNAKQLAIKQSAQTDQTLAAATANSTFDSTLSKNLTQQLTAYRSALASAYKEAHNTSVKQLLHTNYATTTLLLMQASADHDT